ncbi:MAG: glycoside hydrolase family 43 protein [Acutalibacteraceae bacterium]
MKTKRLLSILLCFSILFGSVAYTVSASDGIAAGYTFTVQPRRGTYSRGETVVFDTSIKSNSIIDMRNWFLWMEYDAGRSFLAPNATERIIETIPFGENTTQNFRLCEPDSVIRLSDQLTTEAAKSVLRSCFQLYSKITKAFVYVQYFFKSVLHGLALASEKVKLGESEVVYDGETIHVTFYGRIRTEHDAVPMCTSLQTLPQSFALDAQMTASQGMSALVFSASVYDNAFDGYVFLLDSAKKEASLSFVQNGVVTKIGAKKVTVKDGETYRVQIQGNSEKTAVYLYNYPSDSSAYPVFEFSLEPFGDVCGVIGNAHISAVESYTAPEIGETYTNPILDNSPDPYILHNDETYYLYATNAPLDGFNVCTSKDLVHWSQPIRAATKGDIYGKGDFWAPEVYAYNGKFYMLYSTDEHLAMAISDSPTGPFVKTEDAYYLSVDYNNIDGHIFFDEDGKIYLYYSAGDSIRGCEVDDDLLGVKAQTDVLITSVAQGEGNINEGPFMLKRNGTYYMTYSINGYENRNYGVSYALSDVPLGVFDKAENNPILVYNRFVYGPGHHCFTTSPDGKELIIAYHAHFSTEQVNPRKLYIDRAKFVPTQSGVDALVVYGPTLTPQPVPGK